MFSVGFVGLRRVTARQEKTKRPGPVDARDVCVRKAISRGFHQPKRWAFQHYASTRGVHFAGQLLSNTFAGRGAGRVATAAGNGSVA